MGELGFVELFSCCLFVCFLFVPNVFSRFTYEIAPVFVLMEQLTLKKMREMIGWPNGEGDGIFSPGESQRDYWLAWPESPGESVMFGWLSGDTLLLWISNRGYYIILHYI